MKTILASFIIATIALGACKGDKTTAEAAVEQFELQEKNYPKTNNYPEADQFDDDMEADFVRAANAFQQEIKAQEALITSRNWVVYNDYSGRPIKRNRIAVVTAQIGDRCFLQHMFFQQDAKGSKYGKTYVSDVYGWKEFDCNLKP